MKSRLTFAAVLIALSALTGCSGGAEDKSLVGSWSFNEGSGLATSDTSGNGNTGTIMFPADGTPHWGSGDYSGALSFSGVYDNHVSVPASASLNGITTAVTITALINPQDIWVPDAPRTAYTPIVQRQWREEAHPDQYYLGFGEKDGAACFKWHVGIADQEISIYALPPGVTTLDANVWMFLAGTYDGATGDFKLYVNGELIGSRNVPGAIRLDTESRERPLIIGAEINGADLNKTVGEFNGYIDEVRLYNRALSEAEIKTLAAAIKRPLGL